jgi:hypothetical protein
MYRYWLEPNWKIEFDIIDKILNKEVKIKLFNNGVERLHKFIWDDNNKSW